jgi:hypothetical protein
MRLRKYAIIFAIHNIANFYTVLLNFARNNENRTFLSSNRKSKYRKRKNLVCYKRNTNYCSQKPKLTNYSKDGRGRPSLNTSSFSRVSCSVCARVLGSSKYCAIHEVIQCKVEWSKESLLELGIRFRPCTIPGCDKKYANKCHLLK